VKETQLRRSAVASSGRSGKTGEPQSLNPRPENLTRYRNPSQFADPEITLAIGTKRTGSFFNPVTGAATLW